MLTPRLTNCPECANIPDLLKRIDCKLAEYANGLYNNVIFMLNQVVPARTMIQLLAYKRILTYKACNPDYLSDFCIDKIISKVIRLTSGCYIKPIFTPTPTTSTTSTSTTCLPTNGWKYNITNYDCNTCISIGGGFFTNSEPLTIGKWYVYETSKIQIDSFIENVIGFNQSILDSSKKSTCEAVVCPTTTTTTTLPEGTVWEYNVMMYGCDSGSGSSGNCPFLGEVSIINSEPLTSLKWYYFDDFKYLVIELIEAYIGIATTFILNSSQEDTCQAIVCPTTTTTTTLPPSFISVWRTTTPTESITLPIYSDSIIPSGTINWGDGNISPNTDGNYSHTYSSPGDYTITIDGVMRAWRFIDIPTSKDNLIEILQWGCFNMGNNNSQFYGCSNLILTNVTDVPNLIGVGTLSGIFFNCTSITTINNFNNWDVSQVTDISNMFYNNYIFNQDINNWDVSNVTDMSNMFRNNTLFNGDISGWNVSGVTNMDGVFLDNTSFNQDLSGWCVTNIPSLPNNFDTGTTSWILPKPIWGTCPTTTTTTTI